jgi:hypothetical protein
MLLREIMLFVLKSTHNTLAILGKKQNSFVLNVVINEVLGFKM